MKFWIKKENDADPDVEWKDSYILTLNRDSGSTIYSGLPSIWYHLGCQKMVPIYEDLFVIGLSVFALDKRITNYVGEIGLDYSQKSYMSKPMQLKYFEQIVEICASNNKLMTIHIRKAEKDAVRILEKYHPQKAIIHWYTGGCDDMLRLVDLGCYFSINTNMVKGSKKENYHLLPLERILIESDGPYTKVNNKKYTPALLKDAYEEISRFYNNPDLPRKIYYNFKKILLS